MVERAVKGSNKAITRTFRAVQHPGSWVNMSTINPRDPAPNPMATSASHVGSGTAITAASRTAGCSTRWFSRVPVSRKTSTVRLVARLPGVHHGSFECYQVRTLEEGDHRTRDRVRVRIRVRVIIAVIAGAGIGIVAALSRSGLPGLRLR
ncbi:hypothetical protein GCM10027262_11540 [Nocardia tengchongensis]